MMMQPEFKDFIAVVDRAGVDAWGNLVFQRAPDGDGLVFDKDVFERVRESGEMELRRITRRNCRTDKTLPSVLPFGQLAAVPVRSRRTGHDEMPLVAEKRKEFRATGEVTL